MVETITPAVCGSRRRQLVALSLFALGAVGAAASLGALLGLVGAAIGTSAAIAVAATLAVLGALREAGIVRFPIPQSKRQVPDWWRYELPLPVWSAGYGAGLGIGVMTYQPVATFWVACAAALALGRPLAGAVAFALYGVGRAAVLVLPARRGVDAAEVSERLVARRRTVLRANAVALGACACLLVASPVAGAEVVPLGPGNQMDPSVMGSGFAYTQRDAEVPQVVIVPSDGSPTVVIPDAESPALFGSRVAYQDALGVAVANWRDPTQEVIRVEGRLEKPGLWGRWLVYRKYHGHELARANRPEHAGHERYTLHLHDLVAGTTRKIAESGDGVEIGRPSIAGDRIAWHIFGTGGSKIVLYKISTGRKTVLLRTKRWMLANPSLTRGRIIWVRDTSVDSTLYTRRLDGTRIRVVATVRRPSSNYWFWTTWLYDGQAYVTRWNTAAEVSRILRERI